MSDEDIKIIENFLNYNKEKYLSGIEIASISQLLKAYREQQKEIEELMGICDSYRNASEHSAEIFLETIKLNYISKDKIILNSKDVELPGVVSYRELQELLEE